MLYKLESLRGIAVCVVILAHSPYMVWQKEPLFMIYADLAVDFFFILSGMVMALAYQDRIKQGLSFKSYILLRLGRLYPLHIFTLFVWGIYILIKKSLNVDVEFELTENIWTFVSNVFLVHSLGTNNALSWNFPSWSISAEFFTYLFFYGFILFNKNQRLIYPFIISVICYGILFMLNKTGIGEFTYNYGFIRCLSGFFIGVFVFRLKKKTNLDLSSMISLFEVIPIVLLTVLLVYSPGISFNYDLLIILAFTMFIYVFSEKKDGFIGKILSTNALITLGKYSYSIYLIHALVLSLFNIFFKHILKIQVENIFGLYSIILNVAIIGVTILISKYTYRHIENYYRKRVQVFL